jgi:4-hydroxybenzoate polyprenyltransferase
MGTGVAHAVTLTDDRGALISLAAPPQRIVSLLPSLTETVCALGACERLVGVDAHSNWPQAVLGLAFAWGGLMGWVAIEGALAWPAVLIYLAAILWTMGYDTIYALQDARDDALVGIKSTARLFGTQVRAGVAALYAAALLSAALALALIHADALAFAGLAAFAAHLIWQVWRMEPDNPASALMLFRANRDAGLILFAGLALASIL